MNTEKRRGDTWMNECVLDVREIGKGKGEKGKNAWVGCGQLKIEKMNRAAI